MADRASGAAWRRRQRRLRSWWRHEQQSIAAVLATVSHHSYSKVCTANAALRGQEIGTSTGVGPAEYFELSSDDGSPTAGTRPASMLDPWPQGKMQQHHSIKYGPADGGTVAEGLWSRTQTFQFLLVVVVGKVFNIYPWTGFSCVWWSRTR